MTLCIEDADYSPFILPDAPAQHAGVLPALAMHAAEQTQQTLKLIRHPWKRCIDMVQKGQVDLILAAIWLPSVTFGGNTPNTLTLPAARLIAANGFGLPNTPCLSPTTAA